MNQTAKAQPFPKTARLLKRSEFDAVYKQGKRHFSQNLTVFYLRQPGAAPSGARIGFGVSRLIGGAVDRNRMKRVLRSAVQQNLGLLGREAVDVAINPKKTALAASHSLIAEEVKNAFTVIARGAQRPAVEKKQ